ncbi:MAG TPA: hypothetical protein VIU11_27190 [Nakamurella sp.]
MRSRSALTAALALSVVTILTVAACGSSVQGAAQVNSVAAETMTSAETTLERTSRTSIDATDLSDLSSMLNDLSTELTVPTGLTFPTDLGDLNIPGYNNACISVSLAYLSVTLAPLATLAGGAGEYDAAELKKALEDLRNSGEIPPEIAPDIDTLATLADQAGGGTLSDAAQLFESEEFVTASDHISVWLDANCSGS